MREALVLIHAGAGIAGLVAGLPLISPPETAEKQRWLRWLYLALIAILLVSLIWLVIIDWSGLDLPAQLTFSGLTVLAAVMLLRMFGANRLAEKQPGDWTGKYVNHVYFTYISLWVGFVIVPALGTSSPGLWVPVAVIGVLVIGGFAINRYKARIGLAT